MKITRHIEYTPRESRLLQEAIARQIAHKQEMVRGTSPVEDKAFEADIADLKKLKERVRLGPRGVLQDVRGFLNRFKVEMGPRLQRSYKAISELRGRADRLEKRRNITITIMRDASVHLNQLTPPEP